MDINKVVFGTNTLIDLTADTVDASYLLDGYTAHDKSGAIITGSCSYDSDTQDATITVAEMLSGRTAYARGTSLTGTMPNKGGVESVISSKTQEVSIAQGYHDGSGKVNIDTTEQAKIIASNIKNGVEILGVTGTLEASSSVTAQSKTVSPADSSQTVLPDSGYDYLSQVTVNAITQTITQNSAGGFTCVIGG